MRTVVHQQTVPTLRAKEGPALCAEEMLRMPRSIQGRHYFLQTGTANMIHLCSTVT